jgi:5-methylcytosine-specific restriction endonuclease McrA
LTGGKESISIRANVMDSARSAQVLVLNRLWQAVNIIGMERTFSLLCQDHAQIIHPTEESYRVFSMMDWIDFSRENPPLEDVVCVHTVRHRIRMPQIILLSMFDKLPQKEVKFTRNNVFERDKNRCQYCGKVFDRSELNLDHVLPRQYGGKTTWENIVCSCVACNVRKGNRLPHEAGMRLLKKPHRPKWRPFISFVLKSPAYESWKHFLDLAYWNVELEHD